MHPRNLLPGLLIPFLLSGPLQAARKETWVELRSPHFQAYGDARPSDVRDVLRAFEEIRVVFHQVFPSIRVDPPRPTILLVVRDEASMKRFLPRQFEGKNPQRPAGLFLTTNDRNYAIVNMDAISQNEDQGMATVFHEYTHSILHLNFLDLPVWLDEGLADFYGATEIKGNQVLIGRISEGRLACLRQYPFLPLETLLTVTHDSPEYQEGNRTGMFYAESWALVHYLLNDESAKKVGLFKAYSKALEENPDSLAAATTAFGDLKTFSNTFRTYSHQSRFHYWVFHRSDSVQASDLTEAPLDAATALLVRAEFMDAMGLNQEAWELLHSLDGAPSPGPALQVALGMNLMRRKDTKGAERAFGEAIRLGTKDFRAPAYLATLLRDHPAADGSTDESLALLEQALVLRPDMPWVHSFLGLGLARDPAKGAQAVQESRKAVQLEPIQGYLRANLGSTYMMLGEEAGAQSVGADLTRQARDAEGRALATCYAGQLDSWLASRRAQAEAAAQAEVQDRAPKPAPSGSSSRTKPAATSQRLFVKGLHFSLPDRLAPLGKEVLALVVRGDLKEAQAKVKSALAQARTPEERKALAQLDAQLKALKPANQ